MLVEQGNYIGFDVYFQGIPPGQQQSCITFGKEALLDVN